MRLNQLHSPEWLPAKCLTRIHGGKGLCMCQDMFLLSLRGTSLHLQKVMQWIGITKRSAVLLGIAYHTYSKTQCVLTISTSKCTVYTVVLHLSFLSISSVFCLCSLLRLTTSMKLFLAKNCGFTLRFPNHSCLIPTFSTHFPALLPSPVSPSHVPFDL